MKTLLIILGLIFTVSGSLGIWVTTEYVETTGNVTAVEQKFFDSRGDGHDEWFPTADYLDLEGKQHQYLPEILEQLGSKEKIQIGDQVTLFYHPSEPGTAFMRDLWSDYLVMGIVVLFGLFFLSLGFLKKKSLKGDNSPNQPQD